MPKMKTNKSAAKRFKRTATGKFLRRHSHKNHILTKKSRGRKRGLAHVALVEPTDQRRIARLFA